MFRAPFSAPIAYASLAELERDQTSPLARIEVEAGRGLRMMWTGTFW